MTRRPRRVRHEPPKVWHNPAVVGFGAGAAESGGSSSGSPSDAGADKKVRAAKIVAASAEPRDPKEVQLERLVERLSHAEGRIAITKIVAEIEEQGLAVPRDHQLVNLQLLEHSDESRVFEALQRLGQILEKEPSKRPTVLDSRLRRLEEFAEEPATRAAASELRKRVR